MNPFGLPDECYQFLNEGRQLDFDPELCEAGPVVLRSASELKLDRLPVETYPTVFHDEDPHLGEHGFYYVLSVPLLKGEYICEAVLLWLPIERTFGTYADSHNDLLLFPNATWSDIVSNPLPYLNAHWEVDERNDDFIRELKPWLDHPFRLGSTLPEVEENRKV